MKSKAKETVTIQHQSENDATEKVSQPFNKNAEGQKVGFDHSSDQPVPKHLEPVELKKLSELCGDSLWEALDRKVARGQGHTVDAMVDELGLHKFGNMWVTSWGR